MLKEVFFVIAELDPVICLAPTCESYLLYYNVMVSPKGQINYDFYARMVARHKTS